MPVTARAVGPAIVSPDGVSPPPPDAPAPCILVVDDNRDMLDLLATLLEAQGYRVTTASSGTDGLARVAESPPALLLLDVILPDIDGYEVARRIRQDDHLPFIPIILVTAKGDLQEKIYGLEQGADDFLAKPVNAGELIARVRALLRLKLAQDHLRRQHDELRELHYKLRDSEALREQLVAMITHDLRGPLAGLLGALELIEDGSLGPLTGDQHHFIRQGLQNCHTLNDMVGDLLDVYRLEAGYSELDRGAVDLHALVHRASSQVQGAIAEKKLVLQNRIPPDFPRVAGDRNKLLRVLANLLNNAVKYTDRGTITVRAVVAPGNGYERAAPGSGQAPQAGQGYAIVQLYDTGIGIPDEARAAIFDKFYRVQPDRGARVRGAGLGLYFCKHVVEAHGGNIWVDPAPGGTSGSIFSFSVPLAGPR